ncbi:MAG TPA: hypothetical protein VKY40_04875 [Halanaerobiales bacterium]|nr:hypothetical protein [Halanaerobiales bacterium]
MDEVISILIWVFFIVIAIVKRVYTPEKRESFNKKNDNKKMQKQIVREKQQKNDIIIEHKKALSIQKEQKTITNINEKNKEANSRDNEVLNNANKSNKQKRIKKSISKKAKKNLRLQRQSIFDDLEQEKALLQGIVFKQILGPPRARDPYKFTYTHKIK